jgi:Fur family ferric uptake transcriptional regulator
MPKAPVARAVDVVRTSQRHFEAYLREQGMRKTEQRRVLLDHIFGFSYHQHFDADQLIAQLPVRGKPGYVSRTTVYRALAEFVDAGLLRKLELDGRAVYEPAQGCRQHDHLYCERCQRLFEFQNEDFVKACDRVAEKQAFRITGRRILIYGICGQCGKSSNGHADEA